jgi:hypothetical protein
VKAKCYDTEEVKEKKEKNMHLLPDLKEKEEKLKKYTTCHTNT